MTTELCFHSDFLTIEYFPGLQCLYMAKTGKVSFAEFMEAHRISLETVRKKDVTTYVSNISGLYTMNRLQEEYANEVYLPALAKTGMKEVIVVVPPEAYNKMILKGLKKHGLKFEYCNDQQEALQLFEREYRQNLNFQPTSLPIIPHRS